VASEKVADKDSAARGAREANGAVAESACQAGALCWFSHLLDLFHDLV
jgi:hypothetical protein